MLRGILGVRRAGLTGNYLGLPSMVGRNKKELLGFIKDRIISRIQGWGHGFLSKAGREVLLKAVIQAIPSYTMSVFLLPNNLVREIEVVMNSFWWKGDSGSSSGIRWKSWNRLCAPKKWGGLGFRSLRDFNVALLSRQSWNIINNPSTLAAKVLKAKYFSNCSFLEVNKGNNPSFIWSSLYETRDVIRRSTKWRVGKGNSIFI